MPNMINKDLGAATAYAYAVNGGYEGSEADFTQLMADLGITLDEFQNFSVTVTTLPAGSSATASYSDGVLSLGIPKGDKGDKGNTGDTGAAAGFGTVSATVDANVGTPEVTVAASGSNTSKNFAFTFKNLKGVKGDTGNGIESVALTSTSGVVKTYTITFTDGDTTTFDVTDGEVSEAELQATLESYAKVDGYYSDLTAGSAEQLLSTITIEDEVPYQFRTSGGGIDIGNREVDTLVGGSVAWNQLVQSSSSSVTVQNGHKYFANINSVKSIGSSNGTAITINDGSKDNVIDLTQMFGSTIADYIYSLEQANAGAGVAWFKKYFPKPYYEYNTGELMSVQASSHDMVGFNAVEDFIVNAQANPYAIVLFAKGKLLPNTDYCISFEGAEGNYVYGNENLFDYKNIMVTSGRTHAVLHTKSVVSKEDVLQWDTTRNAWIILKNNGANAVTPSFTDVCINLSDPSRNGEYEPYEKHSYPLDNSLTLRGIPKLDNGNLYYDGDTYESDGTVTRKYGVVDLGTLSWIKNTNVIKTYFQTNAEVADMKKSTGNTILQPIFCANYISETWSHALDNASYDKAICVGYGAGSYVAIADSSLTDLDATAFKTAMSGVYLVYELATPTTESADPYTNPQIVDRYGTEEYVTTSIVPVGHITKYMPNLVAKLETAPNSPSGDGDYIVRQTSGVNEYVALGNTATIQNIIARLEALEGANNG